MALLDKLNKMAKNIEDKTGDAIEISKYATQKAAEEAAEREDIKKIGKFYYDFYLAGGQVEPEILETVKSAKAHFDAAVEAQKNINRIKEENAAQKAAVKAAASAAPAVQQEAAEPVTETEPEPVAQQPAEEIPQYAATERICSVCGNKLDPGVKFCGECGNKMEV